MTNRFSVIVSSDADSCDNSHFETEKKYIKIIYNYFNAVIADDAVIA